jgi:hypothetical protein
MPSDSVKRACARLRQFCNRSIRFNERCRCARPPPVICRTCESRMKSRHAATGQNGWPKPGFDVLRTQPGHFAGFLSPRATVSALEYVSPMVCSSVAPKSLSGSTKANRSRCRRQQFRTRHLPRQSAPPHIRSAPSRAASMRGLPKIAIAIRRSDVCASPKRSLAPHTLRARAAYTAGQSEE